MTESTARAERFDVQTAASPLYLWEVAQKPVSVRIPFNLIDRLEKEAVESFRSLTSNGSEIGWLLVGNVSPGSPLVVTVSDYDLIPCDYSRGPLYRLSDADMGRFEQAIQQRQAAGRGIAGFFRSHTRKGISLDVDDLAFFEARFRDPHHIALLVRPFATKASTAGIFIWENGKVSGDSSYQEFPFRSSELGPGIPPQPMETKPSAPPQPTSSAAKPASRAQIVPIASRREISNPSTIEPPPPPAPVNVAPSMPPPAPPAPAVEDKALPTPDKQARVEKPARYDRPDKGRVEKSDRTSKPDPRLSAPAVPAKPTPKVEPKSEPAPAASSSYSYTAAAEAPEAKSGGAVKILLGVAVLVIAVFAAFVYPGFMRSTGKNDAANSAQSGQRDSSPLQLRVERSAGELLLTWNPDVDAIKNAAKGVLSITDGEQHENVDMDRTQLAIGRIMYQPSGSKIIFEMQVTDKNGKTTGSDKLPFLRPPSPLDSQEAASKAAPASTPAVANNSKTSTPAATPAAPAAAQEEPVAEPVAAAKSAPRKAFTAPTGNVSLAQRLRAPSASDLPDAPTVGVGGPSSVSLPGGLGGAVGAAPAAPVTVTSTPATTTAANNGKQGGNIQPAVLISRKEPEYPKIAKQSHAKGAVVLTATIGTDGTIKKVKVISGHPMLTRAAEDAVRQWKYKPTLLNGQPVEAETQVTLNFQGDR